MSVWGGRGTGAMGRRDPYPAVPSPSRRWVGLEGQGETLAMPTTEPAGTACSGVETGPPCTLAMGLGHPKRWARSVHLGRKCEITPAGRRYGMVQIVYHEQLTRRAYSGQ